MNLESFDRITVNGYLPSLLTIFFGVIPAEEVQTIIAIIGGCLTICLAIASLYLKAQEIAKNALDLEQKIGIEKKRTANED